MTQLTKLAYRHQSVKKLCEVPDWYVERAKHDSEILPARIALLSQDPDGLASVNQDKLAKASIAISRKIKPYRDAMDNKHQWLVCAIPGKAWAKKMFPNDRTSVAVEKLWEAILDTSRVDDNPVEAWNKHNADLKNRCDYLNGLGIKELKYKASNGTDFRVGLLEPSFPTLWLE